MAAATQSPAAAALQAGYEAVQRADFLAAYGFFNAALADPALQVQVRRGWARRAGGGCGQNSQRPAPAARLGSRL